MSRTNRLFPGVVAGLLLAASAVVGAMDEEALGRVLAKRIVGDRSGACGAAAGIEGDEVARAWRCDDPAGVFFFGQRAAYEIGSITKTMTAVLLADLVLDGEASL